MKTFNAKEVLERLKIALNLESNADISRILEVSPGTISNWIKRNTLDFQLVFSKCEQINIDWLLTGRGCMLRESSATTIREPQAEYKTKAATQVITDNSTTTYTKATEGSAGVVPSVAESQTTINVLLSIIKDKDVRIEELNREIGNLKSEIDFTKGTRVGEEEKEEDMGAEDAACAAVG